ncbi:hypothetical protein E0H75_35360 [Kribbella capetownensis]|uniref:tRNA nuclease CdiA C-terminal domain-containing protein n=1 Tax=Kribbella capetownensis TaxID=1572659 RepID=A0A4R0JCX6_9ACTN|nr:hypothetical protein [Kribbella capetownensis]TCC44149.1 hypothetical protein E0H75_35360 [Kribbella capetownensis]
MASDLQRVARGLVECLDEVPQVVSHLQRTADRCRENAALAIAASQGRATVAAQQLDAAARACEAAAHYLSMAPPKARAWADRLVGGGRGTDRPSPDSADRNKLTGGTGDLAERDSKGRTKRLTATFDDVETPEDNEPPLITVARKAFEKFRKTHKDDEDPQSDEPLEVEITVAETGDLVIEERNEDEDKKRNDQLLQDFEIAVDLTKAAEQLLAAMAESADQKWQQATLTIDPDRVEATFAYPEEDRPRPIVVDINLPPLTEHPPDFDPAFDPEPLGVDFAPGVHDPRGTFKPKQAQVASRLAAEDWRIDARVPDHGSGQKSPDAMVRKSAADRGAIVEFRTPESSSNDMLESLIGDGGDQATEIVIDGRNVGLTESDASRAYRRAVRQPGRTIADVVHLILGDGRMVTYRRDQ